jgi:mycofactocin precursor
MATAEGGTMDDPTIEQGEETEAAEELSTDLLIEEVSIDGLCGVY